jgi:hypothetical protein
VSNPKYRNPIPEKKQAKPKEEGLPKVIEAAIDLGQEIEKHNQKAHKPDVYLISPEVSKTKEGKDAIKQFDKIAESLKQDVEPYWNRNIFTRAVAKIGRFIKW